MKKKTMKRIGLILIAGIIIAGSIGAYLFFKPHRNVQATSAYATLKAQDLTNEFTADAAKANAKYLASDGNSKVLIIEGRVSKISTNQNGEQVIVLKDEGAKVGVSATFTKQTSANTMAVKVGDIIKIKGAITAGNRYDADLDLYEHAILVQSDIEK
jgi:lysyl-tRNA synthetase class II